MHKYLALTVKRRNRRLIQEMSSFFKLLDVSLICVPQARSAEWASKRYLTKVGNAHSLLAKLCPESDKKITFL